MTHRYQDLINNQEQHLCPRLIRNEGEGDSHYNNLLTTVRQLGVHRYLSPRKDRESLITLIGER